MFTASGPRRLTRPFAILAILALTLTMAIPTALGFGSSSSARADDPAPAPDFKVLVFSKTAAFQHPAIPLAKAAIQALGAAHNFDVVVDDDAGRFTDAGLADFDAVIFNSTTGDVLDATQQTAFEHYIEAGGGFVGLHSATDTEYDWPWYGQLVGGYFDGHPAPQLATLKVEDHVHPSTAHLGDTWTRTDEWYNIKNQDRDKIHVLLSLDEKSYTGGTMGAEHPISWCQNFDGGRSWYSGLGHTDESYSEPDYLTHLLGGIETAAGAEAASCGASQTSSYELVPLDQNTDNPMLLDIAPDKSVFYAERDGRLRVIDPITNVTSTAMTLPVTTANEDGFLGLVLDPDFGTNHWIYTYWSPLNVGADGPHNRLSRFVYDPATKTADLSSEKAVLKIPTQRERCCHMGGDMKFDTTGNLVLVVGDNTDPFESSGYNPIDERAGRQNFDAQRTAGNTNDLRGKVLRITPQPDGTYTVPAGNLFAPGTPLTKPEIYGMGFRNPFRIGIDPKTNNIMVADYGPDAGSASATRGPDGRVEWNLLTAPGNYGWPYCTSDTCYNDYNFATDTSGPVFNPAALVNNSPNNTGMTNLPPMKNATVWYGYSTNPLFPEIGGGGAPMAGPVYRYDPNLNSTVKWPEYWDGKALFGEWNQGKMYSMQLDQATGGTVVDINRILPGIFDNSKGWSRPMDFKFGPDGALYIIDWGSGFSGNNTDSGIYKVNYTQGDPSPIARAAADVTEGAGPLTVNFSSTGTRHPLAKDITLQWTFGDGSPVTTDANPTHTYTVNGSYNAQLLVTDVDGKTATANVSIVVGNQKPIVTIDFPDNGGFFEFGDQVNYHVTVADPDGVVDCANVVLAPALGHDSHAHPMEILHGCDGSFQTAQDSGHGADANIFWVVEARYTDDGGAAGVPLMGSAVQILQPKRIQSEFFSSTGRIGGTGGADDGVKIETTSDSAGGGKNIGYVDANDWWAHEPVSLLNINSLTLRAANPNATSTISVRWGSPTGQELGQIPVTNTGGWQSYQDFTLTLDQATKPTGSGGLFFVLLNGGVNVNWLQAEGAGVTSNVRPTLDLQASPLAGSSPLTVDAVATSTDPDGDSASLVYSWNKGEGAGLEVGTASQSFTYNTPGTYRLTSRVTDAGGAYHEQYVTVTVTDPLTGLCLAGKSDGFDGSTLDETRWSTVVRRNQELAVTDGHLKIPASKTDIYGAGPGTVSNIVLQDMPSGAWQATTKVTLPARTQYQQAGLVLYGDDDNYAKMVLQGRGSGSTPNDRVFQFIREEGGAPHEVDASNSAALGATFPDTYYVRLASDGTNLTAGYSADGIAWTTMPETKALAGLTNPRIGLLSFANDGSPAAVIDAQFDWFTITPDATAVAGPDDQFDGTALNGCRWSVVNEDTAKYRVQDGSLQIDTTPLDIYGGDTGVKNFVLQSQPTGDWTVETKIDATAFDRKYQQGGIILRADDDNYVKVDFIATNTAGDAKSTNLEVRSEIGGVVQDPQNNAAASATGIQYLRLTKSANAITGSYSADGTTWVDFPAVTNPAAAAGNVGLFALGNSVQTAVATAKFDYFRVVPQVDPLVISAAVNPAAPNGAGWYTAPVTVTLSTEGGAGDIYREYALDGAGWQEYTTPVVVSSQGSHTLQYRASSTGDNTDTSEATFKIDSEAPVSTGTVNETARTVTLASVDATSGVATVEYSTDAGSSWTTYTAPVVVGSTLTTVQFRATDSAGNVETAKSAIVPAAGVVLKSTATLAAAKSKLTYGKAGQLIVQVTAADSVPSGIVSVVYGATTLGSALLINGTAEIALPSKAILPGTGRLVSVRYSGSAVHLASQSDLGLTIAKATSKTAGKMSDSTIFTTTKGKIKVTVSSNVTIAGNVTVKDGSKTLKSNVKLVNGKVTITLPKLKKGTHKLTVTYLGSTTIDKSTSAKVTVKVGKK